MAKGVVTRTPAGADVGKSTARTGGAAKADGLLLVAPSVQRLIQDRAVIDTELWARDGWSATDLGAKQPGRLLLLGRAEPLKAPRTKPCTHELS